MFSAVSNLHTATCSPIRQLLQIACSLVVTIIMWMGLTTPAFAQPQEDGLLAVKLIVQDVTARFRLRTADVRRLSPLIERENRDILPIYIRFGGSEPEYSPALWRELVQRRRNFEGRLSGTLSVRQRSALRSARVELERRVLDYLVGEYIDFLDSLLELETLQRERLDHILYADSLKRHQIVTKHLADDRGLWTHLDECGEETEFSIKAVLTKEQYRSYQTIKNSERPTA